MTKTQKGQDSPKHRCLAVAALLVTVSIWGTTFVITKVALRDVPPFTLTLLRFLLACLILLPLAWLEHRRAGGPLAWGPLVLAGLVGGFLYFALQNIGLVYTTASKASLILASIPALVSLLSALLLRERVGLRRWAGVVASVVGVAIVVLADRTATWHGGGPIGDFLILATAISWAVYTVLAKGLERRATPAVFSAATVGFGALFLLPGAGYELLTRPPAAPTLAGWLSIAYLGLIASTLPFLLWNYALTQIDASEAAVYTNLVPLVAVVSAVLLLQEAVVPAQLLGGLLIVIGVWAAGKGERAKPR